MTKYILLIMLFFTGNICMAKDILTYETGSFHSTNAGDIATGGGEIGKTNMQSRLEDYVDDWNGKSKTGIVRIQFKNMANSDIKGKFKAAATGGKHVVKQEFRNNNGIEELYLWLDPGKNFDIDLAHESFGKVRIPDVTVESETMYIAKVNCAQQVTITFTTDKDGTFITFDNTPVGTADTGKPLTKEKVPYGTYKVIYKNGNTQYEEVIEVGASNTSFHSEFLVRQEVRFTANENNVTLTIDDKLIGKVPCVAEITTGSHHIVAVASNGARLDESVYFSPEMTSYELKVKKTKTIEFFSNYNNSRMSGADLYIDNTRVGTTPYTSELAYGTYNIRMSYNGKDKKGKLHVNDNTQADYSLVIPYSLRTGVNPFQRDYQKRVWGFSFGYVQKWYRLKNSLGEKVNVNWWYQDHVMNGFQFGIPIEPYFGYGCGMRTGLFVEGYFCGGRDDGINNYEGLKYQEFNLYMPVHFLFRLPLGEEFSFFVNGGLGLDLGLAAEVKGEDYSQDLKYGEDGMPERFNLYGEFGGGLQFKVLELSTTYSIGLINNKSFLIGDDIYVKPFRWSIDLSLMF